MAKTNHAERASAVDRGSMRKQGDSSLVPLAMLALAGSAAYLAWPSRRSSAATRSRKALIAYLRDHLSGSDAATRVVHQLGSVHQANEDGALFRRLADEFEGERAVVRTLLTELRASERSIKRAAGIASGVVLRFAAGGEPGDLSLFRTFEALAIGVQGKRCMWRALQNVAPLSTGYGMEFVELEAMAVRQWEAIEKRRLALVERTLSPTESRPQ